MTSANVMPDIPLLHAQLMHGHMMRTALHCRERGARALEERLGLKSTVAVSREAVGGPPADVEAGLSGGNGDKPASEEPAPQTA